MLRKQFLPISLLAFLFVFHCQPGDSQTASDPQNKTDGSDTNAALLRELEAMKHRIEELEAQLRAQHAVGAAPAAQPAAAPREDAAVSASTAPAATATASIASPATATTTVASAASTEKSAPFAFADFTWLNGNPRTKDAAFDSPFFTPEIRADIDYTYDFRHPQDDTIGGSSEVFAPTRCN